MSGKLDYNLILSEFEAMHSKRHSPADNDLPSILELIQVSFAYMDGRIEPPSSMHRLTLTDIVNQCESGEIWSLGDPPAACMFLTPRSDCLYLGKLAVSAKCRGQGLARQLVEIAKTRALEQGLTALELQSRIELNEVHRVFERLGFVRAGETAHPGFDRPTSITMRLELK